MTTDVDLQRKDLPLVDDCWNRIGVKGDGSCPELLKVVHCHNCPIFAAAGQHLFQREPPRECVEEWTQALAREDAPAHADKAAVLVFRIGEEWLALDVQSLVEVSEMRVVRRVPQRTDRMFLGLANIRGELQMCFALAELLGIEGATGPHERLLIAEDPPRRWALAVDEVAGVQQLNAQELGNVPATVANGRAHFSQGIFSWDNKRVGHLASEQIFAALQKWIG
jgi:chemotaxis-related protein WspD